MVWRQMTSQEVTVGVLSGGFEIIASPEEDKANPRTVVGYAVLHALRRGGGPGLWPRVAGGIRRRGA